MGTWERGQGPGSGQGREGTEKGAWQGKGRAGQGKGRDGAGCVEREALYCRAEQSIHHRVAGMLRADAWMIRPGCHAAPLVEEQEKQQERHQHCVDRVASVGGEERGEAAAGARVEAVWEIVGSRGDVGVGHRADWGVSI
jgi:hypothetical protein